jgi:hypothetical protein
MTCRNKANGANGGARAFAISACAGHQRSFSRYPSFVQLSHGRQRRLSAWLVENGAVVNRG